MTKEQQNVQARQAQVASNVQARIAQEQADSAASQTQSDALGKAAGIIRDRYVGGSQVRPPKS